MGSHKTELTVKLGRKILVWPVAHHWAVKAGDTWYEVAGASKNDKGAQMVVNRYTLLGGSSFARLCQQKIWEFPGLLGSR